MSHPQAPYSEQSGGSSCSSPNSHNAGLNAFPYHIRETPNHAQETAHTMGGNHHTNHAAPGHSVFFEDAAFCHETAQRESASWKDDSRYVEVPRRFGGGYTASQPINYNATPERTRGPPNASNQASRLASQHGYQQSHYDHNGTYYGGSSHGTVPNEPQTSHFQSVAATHAQQQPERSAAWLSANEELRSGHHHRVAEDQQPDPYDSVGYIRRDRLVYGDGVYYRSSDYDDQNTRSSGSNRYDGSNDASF